MLTINIQILAGLVDQYLHGNNAKALDMAIWMAEYFGNRVIDNIKKRSIAWHWEAMNEETGGMNDVLYTLYTVTVYIYTLIHMFAREIRCRLHVSFKRY